MDPTPGGEEDDLGWRTQLSGKELHETDGEGRSRAFLSQRQS